MSVTLALGFYFFFNDTATTEIYTLSLHDALPISAAPNSTPDRPPAAPAPTPDTSSARPRAAHNAGSDTVPSGYGTAVRSEEHTSELQSLRHLVCRLLLEKKKKIKTRAYLALSAPLQTRWSSRAVH